MRFGIGVGEGLTLEEISQRFDVTRERIRQIETKAVRRLQHPERALPFARLALGVKPKPSGLDVAERAANIARPQPEEQAPAPINRKQKSRPTRPATSAKGPNGVQPLSLDRLLERAVALGVTVQDGRATSSGRIWVRLLHTPDVAHRKLARWLIDFGFAQSREEGYWK